MASLDKLAILHDFPNPKYPAKPTVIRRKALHLYKVHPKNRYDYFHNQPKYKSVTLYSPVQLPGSTMENVSVFYFLVDMFKQK